MRLDDFLHSAATMGLEEKVVLGLIENMNKALPNWKSLIEDSFLSEDMKKAYEETVTKRLERLQENKLTSRRKAK